MPTISLSLCTYAGETDYLVNLFNSMVDLQPDQVCIADTTRKGKEEWFWDWLKEQMEMRQFKYQLRYYRWAGSFSDIKNAALDMVTSDWAVVLDSDEMLTIEAARDMRSMLANLPEYVTCVRYPRISLLDDTRCLHPWEWPLFRPSLGMHARILKAGVGRYEGIMHERYEYPGRRVDFHGPTHPKWDWRGYYFIHTWLYKDAVMRRRWGKAVDLTQLPAAGCVPLWRIVQEMIVSPRRDFSSPGPIGPTWRPIEWEIDPSKWIIIWDGERREFIWDRDRRWKGQAQR